MPATIKVPLGASTTVRKWFLDVDTSYPGTATWVGVFGMAEFKPTQDDNLEDDSDFDSSGFESETKTSEKWGIETKLRRKTTEADSHAYDPGQEYLRSKAQGQMGVANRVHVRWYEMEPNGPRIEAYEGFGAASWSPEGGEMKALDMVTVKISGQGRRQAIAHPEA